MSDHTRALPRFKRRVSSTCATGADWLSSLSNRKASKRSGGSPRNTAAAQARSHASNSVRACTCACLPQSSPGPASVSPGVRRRVGSTASNATAGSSGANDASPSQSTLHASMMRSLLAKKLMRAVPTTSPFAAPVRNLRMALVWPARLVGVPGTAQGLVGEFLAHLASSGPTPVLVEAVEHVVDVVRLDLAHRRVVGGMSQLARPLTTAAGRPAEQDRAEHENGDHAAEDHERGIHVVERYART